MNNTSSTSRENKKKQLRRQIVPTNPEPFGRGGYDEDDEDSREVVYNAHRKVVRRRIRIVLVLLALAAIAGLCIYRYSIYHEYTDYQVVWEKDFTVEDTEGVTKGEGNFNGYVDFADGILKYTKDGVSYLDAQGKVVWNQSYEMKSPIISVNGEFAAVADQQGTSIYICDKSGSQGKATSLLPIMRVAVSAKGVVAALSEDSKASYINMFHKDGSDLKISVKSLLSKDGYPVDISLSPNGTQLVASFMYLDKGMLKCKVIFYNFGLGKNDPKRVVGILYPETLNDGMVGRVRFLDESHCVLFSDKGLVFVSTRVETEPEAGEPVNIEEEIRTIYYTDRYVAVITDNVEGGDPYRMRIYGVDGAPVLDQTFNFQYSGVNIDGDLILLYNDSGCQVFNLNGVQKFTGSFDFTVSKVSAGRFPGTLLVTGPQMMKEIRLQ
ncbi:hypothetical protein DWV29_13980 [Enterocloster asparagiformis]|jgi:hypothetical protein|uniref:WD40 repeat domain-containing protein n=1 Tax=Enterocloster asparagiformis TaxID=333367 RepID=A0A413FE58_9FIRM|nr:DUF5711 family protein [Enterocloster asparagiformis]RGX28722.1 hypothetical protein DWV29_13980 [Enterocloster asparagiformis]